MSSLISALNWYHKKIGAYDKELWEKSVDQRILRGVCAIPKKTTRIKTELIDVDLVRGSAFAKAKPQHSWIAAAISGIKRVLLLPIFYSWWKLQTNSLVSCLLVILYFLQLLAMYLYFTASDTEFPEVPVSEILTPVVMSFILGGVHSQIVATFTSKKSPKRVCREKRRRLKCKRIKKDFSGTPDSKSSDSVSEEKPHIFNGDCSLSAHENWESVSKSSRNSFTCKKLSKMGQHLRFSFEDNSKTKCSNEESGVGELEFLQPQDEVSSFDHSSTHILNPSGFLTGSQVITEDASHNNQFINSNACHSVHFNSDDISNDRNISSDEDYFVAKKPFYTTEQWKNHVLEFKNICDVSKISTDQESSSCRISSRRYSDGGPTCSKIPTLQAMFLSHQCHTNLSDNTLSRNDCYNKLQQFSSEGNEKRQNCCYNQLRQRNVKSKDYIAQTMKLPINIKHFSSSCESGLDTTSPNTPCKPQASDLEWPIITNTDCNSDSTDCSSQCSEDNMSDMSPTENPFAWEIREPSKKKLSNFGYTGTDKGQRPRSMSCTIWEQSECKKADLTSLDIISSIIQKVDSSQHSSEYLYIGVFFAVVLSLLPLLFRLHNGVSPYIIHDVTSDVLTLTVPSSEEVAKITDGLLDVMLGLGWRVKLVVSILFTERFTLGLAYFFLLSVAEKTFKQRFLYAKHFCYLTSSRRAKRSDLPHFRLNKVRNIKMWLSIRSYLKKLGPQRSVDVIVSIAFILEVCVVSFLCIQLLKETGQFADKLYCWELLFWTLTLGVYLLRYMVIGTKINKKYRNLSVLITEQINLYLHMEQKPHKKEELILANNVLKLAADLLKELESPFKISGLCANSYLYNITKVIVLSAFSAVLTDVLGFKLKLHKIKIR